MLRPRSAGKKVQSQYLNRARVQGEARVQAGYKALYPVGSPWRLVPRLLGYKGTSYFKIYKK